MSTRSLADLISASGQTVNQVAYAAGIDPRVLQNVVDGFQPMPAEAMLPIADVLGVDISEVRYACASIGSPMVGFLSLLTPQNLPFNPLILHGVGKGPQPPRVPFTGILKSMPGGIPLSGDVSGDSTANTVDKWKNVPLDISTMHSPSDKQVPQYDAGSTSWKAVNPSSFGVSPGTAGQIFITNGTPATAWTSLISLELTHGRFTAGNGGLDALTAMGPLVGSETSYGAFWALGHGVALSGTNYAFLSNGTSAYLNAPLSTGSVVLQAGTTAMATFSVAAGTATLQGLALVVVDSGSVQRASVTTAHGLGTFGGGSSDRSTALGPYPGSETVGSGVFFYAAGNSGTNWASAVYDYGGTLNLQASGWTLTWNAGGTLSSSNSILIGPTQAATTLTFQTDAATAIVRYAGGTQSGLTMGTVLASAGHIRSPSQWVWHARNAGNTGDIAVIHQDASDNLVFGDISVANSIQMYGANFWWLGTPSYSLSGSQGSGGMTCSFPYFLFGQSSVIGTNVASATLTLQTDNSLIVTKFSHTTNVMQTDWYDDSGAIRMNQTVNDSTDFVKWNLPTSSWSFEWAVGNFAMIGATNEWAVGGSSWWISAQTSTVYFGGALTANAPVLLDFTTTSAPTIAGGLLASSLTVGTNKSGASLILQGDAVTTVQTLSANGTELANLSTPGAGTGPRVFGSSGRQGHVGSAGHITLLPG